MSTSTGQKISGNFTAIPELLWDADFDIYEVNIISRIISWQRQNKPFFESVVSLSERFKCNTRTISARLDALIKKGILIKKSNRGRAAEYQVNLTALFSYIKNYEPAQGPSITDEPGPSIPDDTRPVQPLHNTCVATTQDICSHYTGAYVATTHYKNINHTIQNSMILEEEERDAFCERLSPTEEELQAFMNELDL